MRVLQDGLAGGFPCTVPTAGVHPDQQRLPLHGAAAYSVLQRRTVLEGVERHHAVIVICSQKQDGWVGGAGVRWLRHIMQRGIPAGNPRGENMSFGCVIDFQYMCRSVVTFNLSAASRVLFFTACPSVLYLKCIDQKAWCILYRFVISMG